MTNTVAVSVSDTAWNPNPQKKKKTFLKIDLIRGGDTLERSHRKQYDHYLLISFDNVGKLDGMSRTI